MANDPIRTHDPDLGFVPTDAVVRRAERRGAHNAAGLNPYDIVRAFELALCDYTGARYAVTTTSCTMALLLACRYVIDNLPANAFKPGIEIPKLTYIGVANSIVHAGGRVRFRDQDWQGEYRLSPFNIWDAARRFTSNMHCAQTYQCVSFHSSKILNISTHGGAILHDDPIADIWFRKARFDGRTEDIDAKHDQFDVCGYHCYLTPPAAGEGLRKLMALPRHNKDLPRSDYKDLSLEERFR